MANNGWYSVYESERPESGEEVLMLSYAGDFPAPLNMFDRPEDRVYCVCTYFYPGDLAWNEVVGDPLLLLSPSEGEVIIEQEGFYMQDGIGPRNACIWRRIGEISDGDALASRGIICWKRLDFPTTE